METSVRPGFARGFPEDPGTLAHLLMNTNDQVGGADLTVFYKARKVKFRKNDVPMPHS